jgi:methyl-accepting chemotaxis protein
MDQAVVLKLLAAAGGLVILLSALAVWVVSRIIASRGSMEEHIERRLNIAKDELMERVSTTLTGSASDLKAAAGSMVQRMEEALKAADRSAAEAEDRLDTRLDTKIRLLESRLLEGFGADLSRTHAAHLDGLLAEARKIFENFDYLRYGLDKIAAALDAPDADTAEVRQAVADLAGRLDQQQAVMGRAMDEFHAKNASLADEMQLFTADLGGLKDEMAAVRKLLSTLSNQSDTLKNLLSQAIQSMAKAKVAGY